jgi:membrane protein YqaA with SNARE-associated domain
LAPVTDPLPEPSTWLERAAYLTMAAVVMVAVGTFIAAPEYLQLVGYGLYAIPAHLLISFLPNEPALLYVAKRYPPPLVASVGAAACAAAAVLDFWLIGWFVSRGLVRSRLDGSRIYQIAHRVFKKAPFLLIVGSALAPVPFYPVKILAIAGGYPLVRFVIAVLVGRWPRFYLLAIGGRQVQMPNSWLLAAAITLEVLTLLGIWRTRRSSRAREP